MYMADIQFLILTVDVGSSALKESFIPYIKVKTVPSLYLSRFIDEKNHSPLSLNKEVI